MRVSRFILAMLTTLGCEPAATVDLAVECEPEPDRAPCCTPPEQPLCEDDAEVSCTEGAYVDEADRVVRCDPTTHRLSWRRDADGSMTCWDVEGVPKACPAIIIVRLERNGRVIELEYRIK